MQSTHKKLLIGTIFILLLLLSGCTENVANTLPKQFDDIKDIAEDEFNKIKEISENGLNAIENTVINEDKLIEELSKLETIDDETIDGVEGYHNIADKLNLFINILNREIGLDLDSLQGTQDEYKALSKIFTEYTPLVGNYNKIVISAKEYKSGKTTSKDEFYKAIAEFSLEFVIIQGAVFYKPAYRMTGIIYRNVGLNRLAFKYPSIVSHLLSKIHWLLRNLMVNESSEIAGLLLGEMKYLNIPR